MLTLDKIIDRIKVDVGYPIIPLPEIQNADDFICSNFIEKALNRYFRAYPLQLHQSLTAGTEVTYDSLGPNLIGLISAQFVSYFEYPGQLYDDPFSLTRSLISMERSMFRMLPANIMFRTLGTTAARPSYAIKNDDVNRKVTFVSLFQGYFNVIWAMRGQLQDVKPNDEWDVTELAGAYFKNYIHRIRTTLDLSSLPIKLNFTELADRKSIV